jgi:hypothetical protein
MHQSIVISFSDDLQINLDIDIAISPKIIWLQYFFTTQ